MATAHDQIRFDDGEAYQRYMGVWSQQAGERFLQWLAPRQGLRWLDVGCGNGAFTEMILGRCAPVSVHGVDPSEAQLAYAGRRPALRDAQFLKGDAMKLPFSDDLFDVAVMPLVLFFVPEPAVGVAEMARVVAGGGLVAAYSWDILGGGFPYAAVQAEMRSIGITPLLPPRPEASRMSSLRELWAGAGLEAIDTREITVERTFASMDDYWSTILGGPSVGSKLAALPPAVVEGLKLRLLSVLPVDAAGRITYSARANAVSGRVPR